MATVNIAGKDYRLKFDANVLIEIQKRYGEIALLRDKMQDLSELIWVLMQLVNEGIFYDNCYHGSSEKEFTNLRAFGTLFSLEQLNSPALAEAIVAAYNEDALGGKKYTTEELLDLGQSILTTNPNP
jgi:hypothetical protein